MNFEQHVAGCTVRAMDVTDSVGGITRLVACRDNAVSPWTLTDYAKATYPLLANASASTLESRKKRGKAPAQPASDVDDLDL